jgi:tetratricopeptide (TPR) repeat protein
MSRRRLPTRLAAALAALLAAGAASAAAQAAARPEQRISRPIGSRTVFGAANTQACGEAASRGETTDQAIRACTRALEEERPSRSMAEALLVNRGAIHLRRNEGEPALADFEAVIGLNARNAEAHVNTGAALVLLGQPGPAVAAITQAITLGVSSPHKAYFNRGAAREALGDIRGAFEDYSTALEIVPDWGPAEAELARFTRSRRDTLGDRLAAAAQAGGPSGVTLEDDAPLEDQPPPDAPGAAPTEDTP